MNEKAENSRVVSTRGIFVEVTRSGSLPIKNRQLVSEEATRGFHFNLKQSKASTASTIFYYLARYFVSRRRVTFTHSLVQRPYLFARHNYNAFASCLMGRISQRIVVPIVLAHRFENSICSECTNGNIRRHLTH